MSFYRTRESRQDLVRGYRQTGQVCRYDGEEQAFLRRGYAPHRCDWLADGPWLNQQHENNKLQRLQLTLQFIKPFMASNAVYAKLNFCLEIL